MRNYDKQSIIKTDGDSSFYFLCSCCEGKIERIAGEMPIDTTVLFA